MARNRTAHQRGQFESLEARTLLAGDVLVNVVGGTLKIEGDTADNKVLITSGAEAGSYIVTGLDGTTLGSATDPITVAGVRNINVNLGAGSDLAALVGATVRGNVTIQAGEGEDRVFVGTGGGAAELTGKLPADTTVNIRGALAINGGNDADHIAVDDAVAALVSVNAGSGDDTVELGSTAALGDLTARLDARIGVHVNLGDGSDTLNLDQVSARAGVLVNGGIGDNAVTGHAVKGAAMILISDGGIDSVSSSDLDVKVLGVHLGAGADNVAIHDSVFATLGVGLGSGNDHLTTANVQAKVAVLDGGGDQDTLDQPITSTITHQRILGFEIPPDVNVNTLPHPWRPLLRGLLGRLR